MDGDLWFMVEMALDLLDMDASQIRGVPEGETYDEMSRKLAKDLEVVERVVVRYQGSVQEFYASRDKHYDLALWLASQQFRT